MIKYPNSYLAWYFNVNLNYYSELLISGIPKNKLKIVWYYGFIVDKIQVAFVYLLIVNEKKVVVYVS